MKKVLGLSLVFLPLLLICCCCSGYFTLLAYNSPDYSDNDLPFEELVDEYDDSFEEQFIDELEEEIVENIITYGTIKGALSYPSEFLPLMDVCAINIDTDEAICTSDLSVDLDAPSGYGYELEVPEGSYNVYAIELDENGDYVDGYKAYYSKFVTCGLDVSCTSHDPIVVTVAAGEEIESIDPADWYDTSQ